MSLTLIQVKVSQKDVIIAIIRVMHVIANFEN